MKTSILAPALTALLAAGTATLALAPTEAAAQQQPQGYPFVEHGYTTPSWGAPGYWWQRNEPWSGYEAGMPQQRQAGPHGMAYGGPQPTRNIDVDRYLDEQFRRGYEQGRFEERRYGGGASAALRGPFSYRGGEYTAPTGQFDIERYGREAFGRGYEQGWYEAWAAREGQQQNLSQVRQAIQEATQALRQDNAQQAERALTRADRLLEQGRRPQWQQALDEAERALDQADVAAARQALRQARQTMRSE